MTVTSPDPVVEREPVAVFLAGLAAVVDAALIAASALDWLDLTTEQTGVVVGFVTVVTGLIGTVLRARVYAPSTVATLTGPTGRS